MCDILVVDDCRVIADYIGDVSRDRGHNSYVAYNGKDCLQIFKNMDEKLDIAFLDILLPDTTGFELAHKIKEESPETIIIAITGNKNMPEDKYIQAGFSEVLEKPFMVNSDLVEIVHKYIKEF